MTNQIGVLSKKVKRKDEILPDCLMAACSSLSIFF